MNKEYTAITVLVICYKQQEVIKRALESVLCQKEYGLKKIVVCDDCSPDNTWLVLNEYKTKYPQYFDIYRNEKNMGIYQNMEKLLSLRGESDLFVELSGDDAFEKGYFQAVQEYIQKHDVDFSRPISVYADYKIIAPNGKQIIRRQNIVEDESLNRFRLCLHGKLSGNRSLMYNELVIQKHKPTFFDKGLNLAEMFYNCQKHLNAEKAYYVPVVGNIYYGGIGVSTKLIDTDYYSTQAMEMWNFFLHNYITRTEDIYLANAQIIKCKFLLKPTINSFINSIKLYMKSGYPEKTTYKEIKEFTYSMKRRILHKYEKYVLLRIAIKVLYHL